MKENEDYIAVKDESEIPPEWQKKLEEGTALALPVAKAKFGGAKFAAWAAVPVAVAIAGISGMVDPAIAIGVLAVLTFAFQSLYAACAKSLAAQVTKSRMDDMVIDMIQKSVNDMISKGTNDDEDGLKEDEDSTDTVH